MKNDDISLGIIVLVSSMLIISWMIVIFEDRIDRFFGYEVIEDIPWIKGNLNIIVNII